MALNDGDVRVRITGDTRSLDSAMQRTRRSVTTDANGIKVAFAGMDRGIGGAMQNSARSVASLAGAVTGLIAAFGAVRLVGAIREAASFAAEIRDAADRTGVFSEKLQELRFAAEQSGNSVEDMDKALEMLGRRMGEATQGAGELLPVLQQYGIALTDAEGRTRGVDAVLADLADAMQKAGSATERLRIANAAFGRSGAGLVNTLMNGSAALEEQAERARELGAILGDDLVQAGGEADDKLAALGRTLDVQLKTALIELAPIITQIGELLVWLAQQAATALRGIQEVGVGTAAAFAALRIPMTTTTPLAGLGEEARQAQLADVDRAIAAAAANVDETRAELQAAISADWQAVIRDDLTAAVERYNELRVARDELTAHFAAYDAAAAPLAAGAPAIEGLPPPSPSGGGGGRSSARAASAGRDVLGDWRAAMQARINLLDTERLMLGESQAAQDAARMTMELQISVLAENRRRQEAYNAAIAAGRDATLELIDVREIESQSIQQYITDQVAAEQAIRDFNAGQEESIEAARRAEDAYQQLGQALGSAFDEAIARGADLRTVLQGLISDLLRFLSIQTGGSGSPFGDLLGMIFGGLGAVGGGGGAGAVTGWHSMRPGFAGGADFMVGGPPGRDRVPINFMATRGERIQVTPAPEVARVAGAGGPGGGGTVNYYIDNTGADAAAVARLEAYIRSINGSIEHRSVAAVTHARRRNPSMFA